MGTAVIQLTPPRLDNLVIEELLEFLGLKSLKNSSFVFFDGLLFI